MNSIARTTVVTLLAFSLFHSSAEAAQLSASLKEKKPELKSAGPISFGPEGILFVADTQDAAIYALATEDQTPAATTKPLKIEKINEKIAALLGTTPQQILINDLAVNPISHKAYIAVSRGQGAAAQPVLLRVDQDGKLEVWSLDNVKFAKASLPDAPEPAAAGAAAPKRGQPTRRESITDLSYLDGRLLVAGLSNEEFASSLRSIPFPFESVKKGTSVEIFHGAHGGFETRSPVRTFVPFNIGGESQILAAYTCTPLVKFPVSALKPGVHLKGTTIAELGSGNRPLDMIAYKKGGKDFILLANDKRGIMRISTENMDKADSIVDPVRGGGIKGQPYETIADWKGIFQLDTLDKDNVMVIRSTTDGAFNLESLALP
jgi:hypothetical protein